MVVGSFASTFHGEPRATQDIDVVIELGSDELERFLDALPDAEWYVDRETAREALRSASMFNVVDYSTGWKVDLIVRKPGAFAATEFGRRVEIELLGVRVCMATAEDTVLSKLVWAEASGGSERQLRDASGIVMVTSDELDVRYIDGWLDTLGVRTLWERIQGSDAAER